MKPAERAKRIFESNRKKLEAQQNGAEVHRRLVNAVEHKELDESALPASMALYCLLAGPDFAAGFMTGECQRQMLKFQKKKKP